MIFSSTLPHLYNPEVLTWFADLCSAVVVDNGGTMGITTISNKVCLNIDVAAAQAEFDAIQAEKWGMCEDCGEEAGNHSADCYTWPHDYDDDNYADFAEYGYEN